MTDHILSGLTIRRAQLVAEAQKADAALLVMLAEHRAYGLRHTPVRSQLSGAVRPTAEGDKTRCPHQIPTDHAPAVA